MPASSHAGCKMITGAWICLLILCSNIPAVTAVPNFLEGLQGNYDQNSLYSGDQSPCTIADAIHTNNSEGAAARAMFIRTESGNITVYYGTSATCNLVMYNLWSGCLAQTHNMVFNLSQNWLSYNTFTEPCPEPTDDLPKTVNTPSNIYIPRWAHETPPTTAGYFNYPQALFIAQKWTTLQKLTPVVAVLLTLVVVLLISLMYCCVAKRWKRKRKMANLRSFDLNPRTSSMDAPRWNPWPGRLTPTVSSLSSRFNRGSRSTHRRVYSEPVDESPPEDGWAVRLRRRIGIALSWLPWKQTITVVRQRTLTGFGIDESTIDYRHNPYDHRSILGGLDTDRFVSPSPRMSVLDIVPELPNPHSEMQPLAHDQGMQPSTPGQQTSDGTLTHQESPASLPPTHTLSLNRLHRHVATPPPPYCGLATHSDAPSVALADSPTLPVSGNVINRPIGVLGLDTRISLNNVLPNPVYTQNFQPQSTTPTVRIPPARESSSLLPPEHPSEADSWRRSSSHEASIESPSLPPRKFMIENQRLPTPAHGPFGPYQRQPSYPSSFTPGMNQPRYTNTLSRLVHFQDHLGIVGRPASTESLLMNLPETPMNFD